MDVDVVTGATVEVVTEVAMAPERVWALITAIDRIGEWSPECVAGRWLTDEEPRPHVGGRFEGVNLFGGTFRAAAICEVTAADESHTFEWAVLDDRDDAERPGSLWRYDLEPSATAGHTVVRHRFVHGPGATGVRVPAEQEPARAVQIVSDRLDELGRHMAQTLTAMIGAATFSTSSRLGDSVPAVNLNAEVAR